MALEQKFDVDSPLSVLVSAASHFGDDEVEGGAEQKVRDSLETLRGPVGVAVPPPHAGVGKFVGFVCSLPGSQTERVSSPVRVSNPVHEGQGPGAGYPREGGGCSQGVAYCQGVGVSGAEEQLRDEEGAQVQEKEKILLEEIQFLLWEIMKQD